MPANLDITVLCRIAVATLLAVSVLGKVADRGRDARALLVGAWPKTHAFGSWVIVATAALELSSLVMLLVPTTASAGGALAASIGLGGAGAIVVARRRGYDGSCGCFGAFDRSQVGLIHVIRAASLFVIGISVAVLANIEHTGGINAPEMIAGVGLGILWLIVFSAAEAIAAVGAATNRLKSQQPSSGQVGGS